jgi:hypothetical protein
MLWRTVTRFLAIIRSIACQVKRQEGTCVKALDTRDLTVLDSSSLRTNVAHKTREIRRNPGI